MSPRTIDDVVNRLDSIIQQSWRVAFEAAERLAIALLVRLAERGGVAEIMDALAGPS